MRKATIPMIVGTFSEKEENKEEKSMDCEGTIKRTSKQRKAKTPIKRV